MRILCLVSMAICSVLGTVVLLTLCEMARDIICKQLWHRSREKGYGKTKCRQRSR